MLTDREIEAIAEAYVRRTETEMRKERDRQAIGLKLVKRCDVEEPSGAYFSYELTNGESLVGPAGFFVDRELGDVTSFGSGQYLEAARKLLATRRWNPNDEQAVVREMLKDRRR